jgi:hypothetical protein
LDEVDVASILGAPAESLSPESLKALQRLLSDAVDLRRQLDAAEHHRRYLEDHADLYPGLNCLNGHAFLRELDAFMVEDAGREGETWGWLWVIHTDGIDHAVNRYGIHAGEAILQGLFNTVHRAAYNGEPQAYFGFGLFCWLMIDPDPVETERRFAAFAEMHTDPSLSLTYGKAPMVVGKTAAESLDQADQNRLRLTKLATSDTVQL